jgi:hypothetical protein
MKDISNLAISVASPGELSQHVQSEVSHVAQEWQCANVRETSQCWQVWQGGILPALLRLDSCDGFRRLTVLHRVETMKLHL